MLFCCVAKMQMGRVDSILISGAIVQLPWCMQQQYAIPQKSPFILISRLAGSFCFHTFLIVIFKSTKCHKCYYYIPLLFSSSTFHFVHFTPFSAPSLSSHLFSPLQSVSFLSISLSYLFLPAVREKFLTEIQSPRYARLRDWHHDRSARALNIKS